MSLYTQKMDKGTNQQRIETENIEKVLSLKQDIIRILNKEKEENQKRTEESKYQGRRKKLIRKKRFILNERVLNTLIKLFQQNQIALKQSKKKQKITISRIALQLHSSLKTIQNIYDDYLFDNTLTTRLISCKNHKAYRKGVPIQKRMIALRQILTANPFLTTPQMLNKLNENSDLRRENKLLTKKQVRRLLLLMRFQRKKIPKHSQNRNTKQMVEKRYEYCVLYKTLSGSQERILFLGSLKFNRYAMREIFWCTKETVMKDDQLMIGDNVSLIAIISQKGLEKYQIKIGDYEPEDYSTFIDNFIKSIQQKEKCEIFYLAVPFNKLSKQPVGGQLKYLSSSRVSLIDFPNSSPQLNPIQCWFYEFRPKVRRTNLSNTEDLCRQIQLNINKYKVRDFKEFYERAQMHIERGIEKLQF